MLVLSKNREDGIPVNENVIIKLIDFRGDKIRLGIESTQGVTVDMVEVLDVVQRGRLVGFGNTLEPNSVVAVPYQMSTHHSCFLSYSSQDEVFAKRLHEKLGNSGLKVWFDQTNIKGGKKTFVQIDNAIQESDKLLLVLSESSMASQWVQSEIRWAREAEEKHGEQKLFPIRLVDFDRIKQWKCFDSDSGRDLAVEVREYHIPDFSSWKKKKTFDEACSNLVSDLSK